MQRESELLLQALVKIRDKCEHCEEVKSGLVDSIRGTIFLVQRIRRHNAPKTIGFFGAQKRGKSSLINRLLGCNLMPVGPIPMSSVVIKVKHVSDHPQGEFTVDILHADGLLESNRMDLETAVFHLKEYGSRRGGMTGDVDTITVTSNFDRCRILENGGVLVDTPGAESAFGDGEVVSQENEQEAQRAVSILKSTQIVVFVERADLMESNNSKRFFVEHLKPMRPLSVVNFKDLNPDESNVMRTMLRTFGVTPQRMLCVSSREAEQAKKDNDDALLQKSNLPELERRILAELECLEPQVGLTTAARELQSNLELLDKRVAREVFMPAKRPIYVMLQMLDEDTELKKILGDIYELYC